MEKLWLKHYPPDAPAAIALDEHATLLTVFHDSYRRYAERPAFHNWGATLTYADLEQRTREFAAWLQGRGLKQGDRTCCSTR